MELEARLRAFAAVARTNSFSRAAEDLGISQPAISRHVADLEAVLGLPLLIREPRGARLTEAGELLAGYVGRAEGLLRMASTAIDSIARGDGGRLAVAASGTPGVYLMPKALGPFMAARPDAAIDLRLGTSAEALGLVRRHTVEMAFIGGTVALADLDVEPIIEDEIVIVGPPSMGELRTVRQLERRTWISREEGSGTRAATERALATLGLRPTRWLVLPDWEMIKIAVLAGAGVAAISRFAVERELDDGRLAAIALRGWHVVRPLSLVMARAIPLSPLASQFAATIRSVLGPSFAA
jgi:LysR family transcriptional regulator, transcriptional activator of the cysJI operon